MVTYVFALWETQVMTKQKIGIRDKKKNENNKTHTHTHTQLSSLIPVNLT